YFERVGPPRPRPYPPVGRAGSCAALLSERRSVSARLPSQTVIALTIAGSDPSGGAGIQAHPKTFHQLGVYGTAAITLITVQNTTRLSRVEMLDPGLVAEQISAVLE